MEKVPGIELESIWSSLNVADKWAIVQTIAGYRKAWMSISFKGFGSLYFAKDLGKEATNQAVYTNVNGMDVTDSRFAIGPSTGRELFDNGRATVDLDKGPCKHRSTWLLLILLTNNKGTQKKSIIQLLSIERRPASNNSHACQSPQLHFVALVPTNQLERGSSKLCSATSSWSPSSFLKTDLLLHLIFGTGTFTCLISS